MLPGCTQNLHAGRVEARPQGLELVERASHCAAQPFVAIHVSHLSRCRAQYPCASFRPDEKSATTVHSTEIGSSRAGHRPLAVSGCAPFTALQGGCHEISLV